MLSVPKSLSDFLPSQPEPTNPPLFGGMYEAVGKWQDQLAQYVITFINGILFFLLLYLLFRLLMKVLQQVLEYLFKLPGLNLLNRLSGAALSAVEWVFWVWFGLILLSILPNFPLKNLILEGFSRPGSIPYILKESNLFTRIFFSY